MDDREYGALYEFTGWAEQRRSGGGLHHFRFKRTTGRAMCADCARKKAATGSAQQGSLW